MVHDIAVYICVFTSGALVGYLLKVVIYNFESMKTGENNSTPTFQDSVYEHGAEIVSSQADVKSIAFSQEEVCIEINNLVRSSRLKELSPLKNRNLWKQQLEVMLSLFQQDYPSAISKQIEVLINYKQEDFFRKLVWYICEIKDYTQEQRIEFSNDIEKMANDQSGYILFGLIDRLDNINKALLLANLTRARLDGFISIKDFFRLSYLLERIPYVDLENLTNYAETYYDESGDTELLYATGALVQVSIDAEGNSMYQLSVLGEEFIRWGIRKPIKIERKIGTDIGIKTASTDDVKKILNIE